MIVKKGYPISVFFLLLLISLFLEKTYSAQFPYKPVKVSYVIDGDTVILASGEKIRYIGIDAPEIDGRGIVEPFGQSAKALNKDLIGKKMVTLEFDTERYDRYGRILAYLFLPDGRFVNGELVRQGMAKTLTIPPNTKYSAYLHYLEKQAKRERLGIWKYNR